jgi:hypothetical protein
MAERARKTEGFHDGILIELKRVNQMKRSSKECRAMKSR